MDTANETEPSFCTITMAREIKRSKSASTAKSYLAAIKKLEDFFGKQTLALSDFGPTFVADFTKYLIAGGLTATTISLYLRNLRALLKKFARRSDVAAIRDIFSNVSSENGKSTAALSFGDLLRLETADLSAYPPLRRVRSLFLISFYAGGLPPEDIRRLPEPLPTSGTIDLPGNRRLIIVPQINDVIKRFAVENSTPFGQYARQLTDTDYARGLETLGVLLKLDTRLTPASAVDTWAACAVESGISPDHIASLINDDTPLTRHIPRQNVDPLQAAHIASLIADRLNDTTEKWYAMRCFDSTPAEVQARLTDGTAIDTFIPIAGSASGPLAKDRLMQSLLFFRTTAAHAARLRQELAPGAYIFTFSDDKRKPAHIPADQMLTFMFLVNVGADTILYYYPGENTSSNNFEPKDIVQITDGSFCGNVGVVERLSRDRLRVCVRIEALNGALISAEIPAKFLKKES